MRVLEVCAGIGGFSLAAEWMGWEVAGHVEIDPFCTRVLKHHWPDVPHVSNIYDCTGTEFGAVDLLCGGIPCQPFSVAGKQQGERDPRHLWPEFFRLVRALRPSLVVVENVGGFVRLALDACWSDLESAGYACGAVVLPACGVNAPHRRDRIWLVAHRNEQGQPTQSVDGFSRRGELGPRLVAHAAASRPSSGRSGAGGTFRDEARRPESERRSGALADAAARGLRRGESSGIAGQSARGGEDAADATSRRWGEAHSTGRALQIEAGQAGFLEQLGGYSDAADPHGTRPQGHRSALRAGEFLSRSCHPCGSAERADGPEIESSVGIQNDGIPGRLAHYLDPRWQGDPLNAFDDDWEAGVPRVTSGCDQRVNKLKALGNSLVPQVAYMVFRAIAAGDLP